ncbi:MAG: hypothetical protein RLZZ301_230 [Bacteroidota bacterium]
MSVYRSDAELMRHLLAFLFLLLASAGFSQRNLLVVLEGSVKNLATKAPVYGATIDVVQDGAVLTKVLSDEKGSYYASAKISPNALIYVLVSKGGYLVKKVEFDLKTLSLTAAKPEGIHLLRDLVLELYELRPAVDLSFAKDAISEKYTWNASSSQLEVEALVKSSLDTKVLQAYKDAVTKQRIDQFIKDSDKALANKQEQKALVALDSALRLDPTDALAKSKKEGIEKTIQDREKAAALQQQFTALVTEADQFFADSNYTEAEKKYKAAEALQRDQHVYNRLTEIAVIQREAAQSKANRQAFDKAMQLANSLFAAKKYDEAIAKYNEAAKIQPSEKTVVDTEISKIKAIKQDLVTEADIKRELKLANEQYIQKKFDLALETYKGIEKKIETLHKQLLIDQYSKECQIGIKKVTEGINSVSQVYKDQLSKANENFMKGPQFYAVAKNILNSDPMKSRQNEPEVIELKDKIAKMEAYYQKRKAAYVLVKTKDNASALKELKSVQNQAAVQQKYLPSTELPQLQKSIDSLQLILTPAIAQKETVASPAEPAGIRLSAPGDAYIGDPSMAYSDLQQTTANAKEQPYQEQQRIKDQIDYKNYFNSASDQVRSQETATQFDLTRSQRELSAKETADSKAQLQDQLVQSNQNLEVAVRQRNEQTSVRQSENDQNMREWKDSKDYQEQQEAAQTAERQQSELNRLNTIQNQRELQVRASEQQEERNSAELNQRSQQVEVSRTKRDTLSTVSGSTQYDQIHHTADSRVELKTTPNYLKDENGVLFPANSLTEKTYTLKNKEGYVTKVILRRVVVDPNGYGVVYEQITDENGKTYFMRNNQVSTEYIWFNESTGANVLKK